MSNNIIIKVGHRDITVSKFENHEKEAHDARGIYFCDYPYIKVDMQQEPFDQGEKLLHEVFHAIWQHMCLKEKTDEETAITALSKGMAMVIRDNPDLISIIMKSIIDKEGLPL